MEIKDVLKYIDEKISQCVENNIEIIGDYSKPELTDIEDIAHVNYYCGYEKALEDLKKFLNVSESEDDE